MPNRKGNPENLEPLKLKGDEALAANLSFRVTESMKEMVKAQDDPAQFCRDAIQEKLDKLSSEE
ncbi:conserved hypothetical protein [Trichormus variabilis ATCC 29413]|uniref:Uncharacterized protein n=2 Tax=Anabaena variabilis TaxID=264691 RepID=Q3M6H2_TRIV2|nr:MULTISPECIES: hypothetical protein [Nostocaceae]ABA23414.1 conserved hypothetical protein [Trichormus variabilis ATCC 29413]MBC1216871.1 hypothetical protein [Trichormus variabilis ARAD]MBC1258284.1 hypothetical protein [Trichormus variabilis V5]MBC1269546.1 hypothetical protein [Trichormus variabilis FSR]MBC1305079.1 hypothetical protein [Trichormus variabilis N2B]